MFPSINLPNIEVSRTSLPKIRIKELKISSDTHGDIILNNFGFYDIVIFPSEDPTSFITTTKFVYESNTSKMYLIGIVNTISLYWNNDIDSPKILIVCDDNTLKDKLSKLYPQFLVSIRDNLDEVEECDILFICSDKFNLERQEDYKDKCGSKLSQLNYTPKTAVLRGILLANIFSPQNYRYFRYIIFDDNTRYNVSKRDIDKRFLSFKNNTRLKKYHNGLYDKSGYIWTLEKYLSRYNLEMDDILMKKLESIFN